MFLSVCFGMFFVMLSMAEMASMLVLQASEPVVPGLLRTCRAPTSGGQYHWVSEIAPNKHQKFLSYIVGRCFPRSELVFDVLTMLKVGCVLSGGKQPWLLRLTQSPNSSKV